MLHQCYICPIPKRITILFIMGTVLCEGNTFNGRNTCMLCLEYVVTVDINTIKLLSEFCYGKILETCNLAKCPTKDEQIHMVCFNCLDKLQDCVRFFKQCKASYQSLQIQYKTKTKCIGEVDDLKTTRRDRDCIENEDSNANSQRRNAKCEIHSKSKLCSFCGKQFLSYSKLVQHMNSHTDDLGFNCSYCEKILTTKGGLVQHEQTHTGEKLYKCDFCTKTFVQSNQLKTHQKLHTGKDILCEVCPKAFCRPSELHLHMRTHTGEVPHGCTICNKKFRLASHLREHELTHCDLRIFMCKHCGAGFKRRSTLIEHELIHSGQFRHQCALCKYGSNKKWSLTQHMIRHHS